MKIYALFAIICFANPDADRGISCLQYSEPKGNTYTAEKCYERAQVVGDQVKQGFKDNSIEIMEHIIWCVNDRGEPA